MQFEAAVINFTEEWFPELCASSQESPMNFELTERLTGRLPPRVTIYTARFKVGVIQKHVEFRFDDLKQLRNIISLKYPGLFLPPLQIVSDYSIMKYISAKIITDSVFLDERKIMVSKFVQFLIKKLRTANQVIEFFELQSKPVEKQNSRKIPYPLIEQRECIKQFQNLPQKLGGEKAPQPSQLELIQFYNKLESTRSYLADLRDLANELSTQPDLNLKILPQQAGFQQIFAKLHLQTRILLAAVQSHLHEVIKVQVIHKQMGQYGEQFRKRWLAGFKQNSSTRLQEVDRQLQQIGKNLEEGFMKKKSENAAIYNKALNDKQ